ncbi:hypothetical protein [Salininema proteolyticum]|uniref:PPE family protein n=1 Tax=Salininema proteolyticum TaxID=1607685 RepID=A0ABV8TV46_9ACTN
MLFEADAAAVEQCGDLWIRLYESNEGMRERIFRSADQLRNFWKGDAAEAFIEGGAQPLLDYIDQWGAKVFEFGHYYHSSIAEHIRDAKTGSEQLGEFGESNLSPRENLSLSEFLAARHGSEGKHLSGSSSEKLEYEKYLEKRKSRLAEIVFKLAQEYENAAARLPEVPADESDGEGYVQPTPPTYTDTPTDMSYGAPGSLTQEGGDLGDDDGDTEFLDEPEETSAGWALNEEDDDFEPSGGLAGGGSVGGMTLGSSVSGGVSSALVSGGGAAPAVGGGLFSTGNRQMPSTTGAGGGFRNPHQAGGMVKNNSTGGASSSRGTGVGQSNANRSSASSSGGNRNKPRQPTRFNVDTKESNSASTARQRQREEEEERKERRRAYSQYEDQMSWEPTEDLDLYGDD